MTQIVPLPDITVPSLAAALDGTGYKPSDLHGGVVSIGNFDGVHLGHAALLKQTRKLADAIQGPAIACLFDPHPITILRPDAAPKRLTSVAERARRMKQLDIDFLIVCQTHPELLEQSATEFFNHLVRDRLKCGGMVEGENFCFGKNRSGDINLLRQLCDDNQVQFSVAQMESFDGDAISSTRIRDRLASGNVAAANQMMLAPHRISGRVAHGDARGRQIGFPTANLEQIDVVVPAAGVYAGRAWVCDESSTQQIGETVHPAAIHLGVSPTFESGAAGKVEVHLIEYSGDLYGQTLCVEFIDQVRGVQRFDSIAAITRQLQQDIQFVQQRLADHQP